MNKAIVLIFIFLGCSCIGKNQKSNQIPTDISDTISAKNNVSVWLFENQKIKQCVEINYINDTVLSFEYQVSERATKQSHEIRGVATHNSKMDVYGTEIDEDAEGIYPVKEYIYDDKCLLIFRIDMEENRRMIVETSDDIDKKYACFKSQGIMIKK